MGGGLKEKDGWMAGDRKCRGRRKEQKFGWKVSGWKVLEGETILTTFQV